MKQALIDLFTSKKFLAALTAIVVYVAGRFGFDVDTAALDHIFAAFLVYVGAQGVADHGKSAAQVAAAAGQSAIGGPPRDPQAGRIRLRILAAIALLGAALGGMAMIGCTKAELGATATSAKHAVVNCTGETIGTAPALDLATLIAIASQIAEVKAACTSGGTFDWSCAESAAIAKGKTIGGCALAQLFASPPAAAKPVSSSMAVAPSPPDPARAALEDFRARAGDGATYHTASGDL